MVMVQQTRQLIKHHTRKLNSRTSRESFLGFTFTREQSTREESTTYQTSIAVQTFAQVVATSTGAELRPLLLIEKKQDTHTNTRREQHHKRPHEGPPPLTKQRSIKGGATNCAYHSASYYSSIGESRQTPTSSIDVTWGGGG